MKPINQAIKISNREKNAKKIKIRKIPFKHLNNQTELNKYQSKLEHPLHPQLLHITSFPSCMSALGTLHIHVVL